MVDANLSYDELARLCDLDESDMDPDDDDDDVREKAMEKRKKISKIKPTDVLNLCKLQECGTRYDLARRNWEITMRQVYEARDAFFEEKKNDPLASWKSFFITFSRKLVSTFL
jgi:hypothetical protein